MSTPTQTFSHDIFVPREIVFDLWSQPEHLVHWFPQLTAGTLAEASAPQELRYLFTSADASTPELTVLFEDLGSNTRIQVSQTATHNTGLPTDADAWHDIFQSLETYLSSI